MCPACLLRHFDNVSLAPSAAAAAGAARDVARQVLAGNLDSLPLRGVHVVEVDEVGGAGLGQDHGGKEEEEEEGEERLAVHGRALYESDSWI